SFFFLLSIQYVYVRRILLLLEYRKVKSFPFLHSLAFHVQSGCKSNYLFLINKTFYAFFEKKIKSLISYPKNYNVLYPIPISYPKRGRKYKTLFNYNASEMRRFLSLLLKYILKWLQTNPLEAEMFLKENGDTKSISIFCSFVLLT